MIAPTYKREDCRKHKPGEHEEGFKELGTSQAGSMSHPAQVRGITDSVGSKCLQFMPEKKHSPPESLFRKRMRLFLKWIFPNKNSMVEMLCKNSSPYQPLPRVTDQSKADQS